MLLRVSHSFFKPLSLETPSAQLKCGWMNTSNTIMLPGLQLKGDHMESKCPPLAEKENTKRETPLFDTVEPHYSFIGVWSSC